MVRFARKRKDPRKHGSTHTPPRPRPDDEMEEELSEVDFEEPGEVPVSAPESRAVSDDADPADVEVVSSDVEEVAVGPGADAMTAGTAPDPDDAASETEPPATDGGGGAEAARRTTKRRRRRPTRTSAADEPATEDGAAPEDEAGRPDAVQDKAEREKAAQEEKERTRSQMLVYVQDDKIQVAILEGRVLVEHYVAHRRAQSIAGNVYLGKVQNVLPGMEAAFVDIGTPKNAVLYAGDVRFVPDEFPGRQPRIEEILEVGQSVLVQVVKDPMGSKGARLTTEISLPGRFLVLVPESEATGISRRLADSERERLRDTLKKLRPEGFGVIVRTAAEETTDAQLKTDLDRLEVLWHDIYRTATRANPPQIVYEEPDLVIRTVREIFSADFRRLIVDDTEVHARICEYLSEYEPDLVARVQLYEDEMPIFRRYHVTEQLKQALSRKVWLPSGGSLVFDRGEALTVIDVNTSKNVGKSSLEETVYQNNLEAADEIARQLRLRDIGGIIVIDFIDMEVKKNRDAVLKGFRRAVAQDKTKTQVYEISELGLVEMTRKNVSEGLLENFSRSCPECNGRGVIIDEDLLM
ncbi:MAG: Rne/Rng family ribonuclease [Acidimicrobiia bacterium]|nr:Rne/Rng family ribonuclease [Acidimicrobiia bacterium]